MHGAVKANFKTNYMSSGVSEREFYREKNARFKKKCKFYRKSANFTEKVQI